MTIKDQDVELVAGEAVEIRCPVTRQADGSMPNLDGSTCTYTARVFATGEILIGPLPAIVGEILDAKGNLVPGVRRILEGEDTAALTGNYYHEFRLRDVAGRPFVTMRGALISRVAPP